MNTRSWTLRQSAQSRLPPVHKHGSLHKCRLRCALHGRANLHNTGRKNVHKDGAFRSQVAYECGERRAQDLGAFEWQWQMKKKGLNAIECIMEGRCGRPHLNTGCNLDCTTCDARRGGRLWNACVRGREREDGWRLWVACRHTRARHGGRMSRLGQRRWHPTDRHVRSASTDVDPSPRNGRARLQLGFERAGLCRWSIALLRREAGS